MPINVEWQDENGNCLARYDGVPIEADLPEHAVVNSACLRFIDPYGDTTFNQEQVAVLESELVEFAAGETKIALQAESLLKFIGQLKRRTHCHLKFIGD